jgi:hypothetical protein
MHYRNGKEAHDGDPVIGQTYKNSGVVIAGKIHSINPGQNTCNCTVAVPVMGGVEHLSCRNVDEFYSAADAFAAMEQALRCPAVEVPPPPAPTPKFL